MNGGSKQTTTQNSSPWPAAQPALKQGINAAQSLYNSGTGAKVYTGSTVVPWDAKTQQGMGQITDAGASAGAVATTAAVKPR